MIAIPLVSFFRFLTVLGFFTGLVLPIEIPPQQDEIIWSSISMKQALLLRDFQMCLQSASLTDEENIIHADPVFAPRILDYWCGKPELHQIAAKHTQQFNGMKNFGENQNLNDIQTSNSATGALWEDRDNEITQQRHKHRNRQLEEDAALVEDNASETLKNTFKVYLPLLLIFFGLFCVLRRKYPQTYNVRNNLPDLQCELAKEQYGLVSWIWNLFKHVSEEELLEQCGMDAVCLLRVFDMGLKLCAMGIVLSFVLLPVYKRAPSAYDTANIKDPIAQLTVANIPKGSNLLILTVAAAYVLIGYAMHLALEELKWYARLRSKYLSRPDIRNYTVYVSGIPKKYRSDEELANFFRKIFSENCVADARVALKVPKLKSKVSAREKVLLKLEHAINIARVSGAAPTHSNPDVTGEVLYSVDSIAYYKDELDVLNKEIKQLIKAIQRKVSISVDDIGGELKTSSEYHTLEQGDPLASHDYKSSSLQKRQNIASEDGLDFKESLYTPQASAATCGIHNNNAAGNVLHQTRELAIKTGEQTKELLVKTGELIGLDDVEDGTPYDAGFVTFTKLSTASAAKQMVHSITPFEMEISDAPDPEFILWRNVGKTQSSIQLGKTVSRILTTILCLFWTVPVSFLVSWTNVDTLKKEFELVNDWIEAAPILEPLLAQIGPLLLLFMNSVVLSTTLKSISKWEGLVGKSFLAWAVFKKKAAFEIIQTFFVASLAGSVTSGISEVFEGPRELLTFLATSLPPQSTLYIQLMTASTVMGLGLELLRTTALMKHFARKFVGPRLSEKERNMVFVSLRPLSNPRDFRHSSVLASTSLYFMVIFVYATLAPIVCYVLLLCFLAVSAGYRHQLIYIYPPKPDSGGRLWVSFIFVYVLCAFVAELTLLGYLALKESHASVPLMIILLVITGRFFIYIQQRHFRVANFVSSEECRVADMSSNLGVDFESLKSVYRQPWLNPEDLHPENLPEDNEFPLPRSTEPE